LNNRFNPLPLPEKQCVQQAKGWLGLEATDEAAQELKKIRSEFLSHPEVLEIRWALAANSERWDEALRLAQTLASAAPSEPEGLIYQSTALVELNRLEEAYQVLLRGSALFPGDEIIAYDLACICSALERTREAVEWIQKAVTIGGPEIRTRALEDPGLASLLRGSTTDPE
jgi:Flp pilus assembly protein TadD